MKMSRCIYQRAITSGVAEKNAIDLIGTREHYIAETSHTERIPLH